MAGARPSAGRRARARSNVFGKPVVCVKPFWCVEPVVVVTCENDRAKLARMTVLLSTL